MLRRSCLTILGLVGALFALYFWFFSRSFEWPGNLLAAGLGSIFGAVGLGGIGNQFWARRDAAAFRRAARNEPFADGGLVVAAGPIRPLGAPLTSPFSGRPCVAYEYEVVQHGPGRRGDSDGKQTELAGFAMAASVIETPQGVVRLLGFPLLDEFPQAKRRGGDEAERARRYAAATSFERGVRRMVSAFEDALQDADGVVRKDFRKHDDPIPFEARTLGERVVEVGQPVCALGRYDAGRRALVPRGMTPNRMWPDAPGTVERSIVSGARSQAKLAFLFFAVSHGVLGGAFYLSETRNARLPEARQAGVIREAIQAHDVAALEQAIRRGANPDARDSFGDPALLDVRDPVMAAALVRLGARVDVRHREDGDTPLIRAARMGLVDLVQVYLAARADVHAVTPAGATALSEALRGGHAEVAALLRAAGATEGAQPVEGSPVEVERPSPR